MVDIDNLPENRKLIVLFRVEPGCLGPEGVEHIERFCEFAASAEKYGLPGYVSWRFEPRYDKNLPEISYCLNDKGLSPDKVERYLSVMGARTTELEDTLEQILTDLIDSYFGR